MKVNTPKLNFPLKFQVKQNLVKANIKKGLKLLYFSSKTTLPNRGWFIDPIERMNNNFWPILIAIIPAFLATILIFMGILFYLAVSKLF